MGIRGKKDQLPAQHFRRVWQAYHKARVLGYDGPRPFAKVARLLGTTEEQVRYALDVYQGHLRRLCSS